MPDKAFKITLHMVSSLDGYIAKKDNSISWFETSCTYEKGVDGEDPIAFLKTIDCYVMGSKTYELAVELSKNYGWAYGDTKTIVVTNRILPKEKETVEFYTGDLVKLVEEVLQPNFKNVWVAGGASLANTMIRLRLIHEIRLSILPIILGDGVSFFESTGIEQALNLKDAKAYKNGVVELCYEVQQTK